MQCWGQCAPSTEAMVATPLLFTFPKCCSHSSESLTSSGLGVCDPGRRGARLIRKLFDRAKPMGESCSSKPTSLYRALEGLGPHQVRGPLGGSSWRLEVNTCPAEDRARRKTKAYDPNLEGWGHICKNIGTAGQQEAGQVPKCWERRKFKSRQRNPACSWLRQQRSVFQSAQKGPPMLVLTICEAWSLMVTSP